MSGTLRIQGAFSLEGTHVTPKGRTRRMPIAGLTYRHESGFKIFVPESHNMGQRHHFGVHAASYAIGDVPVILHQSDDGGCKLVGNLPASWLIDISGDAA